MCGIIGYVGKKNAVPIVLDGLKKLEYRGYDSAGIAVFEKDGISIVKQKGRLSALENRIKNNPRNIHVKGNAGIGHTRWATHGEPSDINSHPHLGSKNKIAVVHNGIIENYSHIKEWLEEKGIKFQSETDSEAVAQLLEYYYDGDLTGAVIRLLSALEGSYALGIMCVDMPGTLLAVKKDNPLIIGVSEHGNFIASDIPAVLKHTKNIFYMNDREIALLSRDKVEFLNIEREKIFKKPETITWNLDSAEKGGYSHFMLKEIMEQPFILKETINSILKNGKNNAALKSLDIKRYKKIIIAACGSAYNAGLVAKYVFESLCRIPVEVDIASEFRYKDPIVDKTSLVILVSQSGETADTIAAMREAKSKGALTFAIVNVVGSTIARESDLCIFTAAGPEIAVATTKAFSAQLVLLYLMAVHFASELGCISGKKMKELHNEISSIPAKTEIILKQIDELQKYAASCVVYKSIFFIGRNIDYAIATEGSLKLKEISYIHSEAYAGGELKHGTISLIEDNTLVVTIAGCDRLFPKIISNVEQVLSRGAKVLLITPGSSSDYGGRLVRIEIPAINELFSPSLSVIVLQLLSYYVAANKGLDIDKPRNLAKSVTVE